MKQITDTSTLSLLAFEDGFDPIEERLRANIRSTIEAVFQDELDSFLGRLRYRRGGSPVKGYRNGTRDRQITGTLAPERSACPADTTLCYQDHSLQSAIATHAAKTLRKFYDELALPVWQSANSLTISPAEQDAANRQTGDRHVARITSAPVGQVASECCGPQGA